MTHHIDGPVRVDSFRELFDETVVADTDFVTVFWHHTERKRKIKENIHNTLHETMINVRREIKVAKQEYQ